MKIVIASDSFKGSASSLEIAGFIEKGIRRVDLNANVTKLPLADGGEGTVDTLVTALQGQYVEVTVTGPLGEIVNSKFGIIGKEIAVIEMAEASGLPLIRSEERNPFKTTTYGTGELIKSALDHGVKEILLGIGGSATNDAGAGMAQALGVSFKDSQDQEIGFGAEAVTKIEKVDVSNLDPRIKNTKITILSDVTNPLCGPNGASYVFGPQKGASPQDVVQLDAILKRFGDLIERELGIHVVNQQGAGAAGGLGAGLMAFCSGTLHSGIDRVLDIINLEDHVEDANLVITGEGMMDYQSVQGKAPIGVAKIAKKYQKPVIAIVGSEGHLAQKVYEHGIDLIIDIINNPMSIEVAISNVEKLVEIAGEKAMRAYCLHKKIKRLEESV